VSLSPPIAFYAPLKSPRDPAPSGDRTMARLFIKALEGAGFAPEIASELRTFDKHGNPERQEAVRVASLAEAERLIEAFEARPAASRPRAWFTYHLYYKAPDWMGPRVATALRIPYVVAEASRASKRASGPWALGHAGTEAALARADAVLAMTALDRAALERNRPARQHILDLPPFVDLDEWPPQRRHSATATTNLLAIAMMRFGDKLASYRLLAEALARLDPAAWRLDIVGDGEARGEVATLFAPFGDRVRLHGRVDDASVLSRLYTAADLFVWPAVNEAYGMALLEAQAHGCPVVAGAYGGVASVVEDGRTGLLTPPGDVASFAGAVADLIADRTRRDALGERAREFVRNERSLSQAAMRLRAVLAAQTAPAFA
jgi:glycosyltransferase involved in cell wall biosynthesis